MLQYNILEEFSNKNILITGGTGLIGRQIAKILKPSGAKIKIISLDDIIIDNSFDHVIADLTNFEVCKEITQDMDFVFHVAGIKGSIVVTRERPASFFVPLLMMNTNLLEAARINHVKRLVYTSSIGAYASAETFQENRNLDGPPMDEFPGLAKRVAEKQIESYFIQYKLSGFSTVRLSNVYGPGDNFDPTNAMVIPSLMYRIYKKENPVVIWGDGHSVRDFLYSSDAAEGIILAIYHGTGSSFVNLGSGIGCSIRELVETMADFIDFEYCFDQSKSSGFPKRIMDISLAKEKIKFSPTITLRSGLEKTWKWFQKNEYEFINRKNYFIEQK